MVFGQGNYTTKNLKLYVNGSLESENNNWLTPGLIESNTGKVRLGANAPDNPGVWSNALIGCIIFGTNELTNDKRQKLEGWAAHKYGLTDNLPDDHPYKNRRPIIDHTPINLTAEFKND